MDCSVRGQSTTKAPSTRHPAVRAKPMNCRWRLANTECPHALQAIGERHDTTRRLKARAVLCPAETLGPRPAGLTNHSAENLCWAASVWGRLRAIPIADDSNSVLRDRRPIAVPACAT